MEGLIEIKNVQTRAEAEVIKSFLASHTIWCTFTADDRGGAAPYPFSSAIGGVRIFVKPDSVTRTRQLLADPKE